MTLRHRLTRRLFEMLTGVNVAAIDACQEREFLRVNLLEHKLAQLTRENAELRERLRPPAGSVIGWRRQAS